MHPMLVHPFQNTNTTVYKWTIGLYIVIVSDFKISLVLIDISSRQKFNKETSEFNFKSIEHRELADIYKIFHPIAMEYTFF
jgi:hypothetical protein